DPGGGPLPARPRRAERDRDPAPAPPVLQGLGHGCGHRSVVSPSPEGEERGTRPAAMADPVAPPPPVQGRPAPPVSPGRTHRPGRPVGGAGGGHLGAPRAPSTRADP